MFGGKTTFEEEVDGVLDIRLHDICRFSIAEQAWYDCDTLKGRKHPAKKGNHRGLLVNNKGLVFGGTKSSLRKVLEITFD